MVEVRGEDSLWIDDRATVVELGGTIVVGISSYLDYISAHDHIDERLNAHLSTVSA